MIRSINPVDGSVLAEFQLHSPTEVSNKLNGAVAAQRQWRQQPLTERLALLNRMAALFRRDRQRLAEMITLEMGKPLAESLAEIDKCAYSLEAYINNAPKYLEPEIIESNASESYVQYDPLGVVLAIMPWNYPFWQFIRFAAPAFALGNGAVLKHAANVPQSAQALEDLVREAAAPEGLLENLFINSSDVAAIIADERIAAVTLTGSTQVGQIVAAQAGAALKKQVLELGGSDAFIVLADADIEKAAATAVRSRFINVGQSCVNAKRFIVERSVADEFVTAFVAEAKKLKVGNPMQPDVQIGPMARANLRDELHQQVLRTLEDKNSKLLLGGEPIDGPGFYYPPTVIDCVEPGMAAFDEETFGPVAAIIRADNEMHAIELANRSEYGLGSAIWTSDLEKAKKLSHQIEAGAVFINGMVASDARLPFGGIKKSGYGRELSAVGLREFANIKTVWIGPAK